MALANFLGKSGLGASQVLKNFDFDHFRQILLSHNLRICFENRTITNKEGYACADLLIRLLARLYPNININCINGEAQEKDDLYKIAFEINPQLDVSEKEPTVAIIIGDSDVDFSCTKFFVGSDNWLAKFSLTKPQQCGNSINRFGSGAAACFAAANLFRHIFRDQLPDAGLDGDLIYSNYNGRINELAEQGPYIENIFFNDTALIGLGAIGNGTIWALKGLTLSGSLHIIDGEKIDLSNLQRYVLAIQDDINRHKSDLADKFLNQIAVTPYSSDFAEYLKLRGNWNIFRAAICVDSAEDRRLVQGSLPKKVINAWTQLEQCGLSRHDNFLDEPCIVCLYPARKEAKSLPAKIAESLSLTEMNHINLVREYMAKGKPVDDAFISLVSEIKKVDKQVLTSFVGKRLEVFYSEVVCGGVLLRLTGKEQKEATEVPSAFESAMAGIMLAAELVIDCQQIRKQKPYTIQKLNLLRAITQYTYDNVSKFKEKDCVCHDDDYRDCYENKWKIKNSSELVADNNAMLVESIH